DRSERKRMPGDEPRREYREADTAPHRSHAGNRRPPVTRLQRRGYRQENRRRRILGQYDRLAAGTRRRAAGGGGRDRVDPDHPGDGDFEGGNGRGAEPAARRLRDRPAPWQEARRRAAYARHADAEPAQRSATSFTPG